MLYRLGLNSWSHTVPFQVARLQEQTAMTSSMKAFKMGIMAHNSNPRTQGAEAEGLQVWGQFGARTSLRKRGKKKVRRKLKRYTLAPSLQYCFINPCSYLKFSFFLFFFYLHFYLTKQLATILQAT